MPSIGETRTLKDGGTAVFDGSTWRRAMRSGGGSKNDPTDTKGVQASAEQRGRINITLDPALEAHRSMVQLENQKGNVFNKEWGARLAEAVPFDSGAVARTLGGQDYQDYESAARAFESAMLPILSGAAVTDSEAKRMVRAVQPQLGDSVETLRDKARRREQMLNGAVAAVGGSSPFPNSRANRGPAGASGPLAGISPLRRAPASPPAQKPRVKYTPEQMQAVRSIPGGPRGAGGSRTNPTMISTQAQYNKLPVGAWYIDHLGNYEQKVR